MRTRILFAALFALLVSSTAPAGNFTGGAGGGGGGGSVFPSEELFIGAGGPFSNITERDKYVCVHEGFDQLYADTSVGNFVNGTDDLEWENAGWTVTAVGTPNDFQLRNLGSRGGLLHIPGDTADTGFNFQFTRIGKPQVTATTAVGNIIHKHDIIDYDFASFAGLDMALATRFTLTADVGDTPPVTWQSSLATGISMESGAADPSVEGALGDVAWMTPSTGALALGTEGCWFHIARTGVLTFQCRNTTTTTAAANCAAVDFSDKIEEDGPSGYGHTIDLGFYMNQPTTPGSGTAQAYYRTIDNTPVSSAQGPWIAFCDPITAAGALPGHTGLSMFNYGFEAIQGSGDNGANADLSGLFVFNAAVASCYRHENRGAVP